MVSGEPAPQATGVRARAPGETLWALLGSVVLAVVYGWPAVGSLGSAVVGGDVDGYENVWNFWWVKTALFDLNRSVFATDYLYYPTGISLRFHTLNPLNGLITLPFNAVLGYVTTLNLLMLASLAATVFCAYLLVRYFVRDGWAAFGGSSAPAASTTT
jgi:hypothetical protein